MNRERIIQSIVFSITLFILLAVHAGFVLDDSFITYRYSKNLVDGHGLVWNVGEDPVEGYTSFLWVLLNALGMKFGIDPVVFSKAIGSIAALSIVWILVSASSNLDWKLKLIFIGGIALSPPFAFLAMQGMETSLTALLLLTSSIAALRVIRNGDSKNFFLWNLLAFICFLSRPDTAIFSIGVGTVLIIYYIRSEEVRASKLFPMILVGFIILFLLYNYWRFKTFGYLMPNTYYVKGGLDESGLFKKVGFYYVVSFFLNILFPYLLLTSGLLWKSISRDKLVRYLPIIAGCILFLIYPVTIKPIQGFLW